MFSSLLCEQPFNNAYSHPVTGILAIASQSDFSKVPSTAPFLWISDFRFWDNEFILLAEEDTWERLYAK